MRGEGGKALLNACLISNWFVFETIFLFSSCPPEAAIQEMLHSVNRVSFYGFLMALTKNSAVNACIGEYLAL